MPAVENAYCATEDVRKGDIAVPSYTSLTQYVANAAEEIDAAVGHIYKTPIEIDDELNPEYRPSVLFLKKLNWLLASGRLILDVAAAGERDNLHAYGNSMLKEARGMIELLTSQELVLDGADRIDEADEKKNFTGPFIQNEDDESLVESFYRNRRPAAVGLGESVNGTLYPPPVVPYGE